MSTIAAIGHLAGAVVVLIALGFAALELAGWEIRRKEESLIHELRVRFGVPARQLNSEQLTLQVIGYMSEKFSDERLKNRISDSCGTLRAYWCGLFTVIQLVFVMAIVWLTLTESRDCAQYIWLLIPMWVFFVVVGIGFSLVCQTLTGRFPGQARAARRSLARMICTLA